MNKQALTFPPRLALSNAPRGDKKHNHPQTKDVSEKGCDCPDKVLAPGQAPSRAPWRGLQDLGEPAVTKTFRRPSPTLPFHAKGNEVAILPQKQFRTAGLAATGARKERATR